MPPAQQQQQQDEAPTTVVRLEWLDGLLVVFAALAVLNIITALVSGRADVFRMVPCWIVLLAVCLTQRHLTDRKIVTVILGTLLCYGVQTLMYLNQAQASELRTYETALSIGLVYVPLLGFFVLLSATKVDNLQSKRDQLHARLVRLRTDANELVNRLHKVRSGEKGEGEEADDTTADEKRAAFDFYRQAFQGVLEIRYKRDVPSLIEKMLAGPLAVEHGVVFEAPDDKSTEYKFRTVWGLAKGETTEATAASFRSSDLIRFVVDNRRPLFLDEIKRSPNLYETHDGFLKQLFPVECVLPVIHLERVLFVVVVGKQKAGAPVKFTHQLVDPLLATAGQAIGKLMTRDARPSFSTFTPGT